MERWGPFDSCHLSPAYLRIVFAKDMEGRGMMGTVGESQGCLSMPSNFFDAYDNNNKGGDALGDNLLSGDTGSYPILPTKSKIYEY